MANLADTLREVEAVFNSISPDLRADWRNCNGRESWQVTGPAGWQARERFEQAARRAVAVLPEVPQAVPGEVLAEQDPLRRWMYLLLAWFPQSLERAVNGTVLTDGKPTGYVEGASIERVGSVSALAVGRLLVEVEAAKPAAGAPQAAPVASPYLNMTATEAGRFVGVTARTIQNWIRAGKLKEHGCEGTTYQFLRADLEAMQKAHSSPDKQ